MAKLLCQKGNSLSSCRGSVPIEDQLTGNWEDIPMPVSLINVLKASLNVLIADLLDEITNTNTDKAAASTYCLMIDYYVGPKKRPKDKTMR